MNGTTSANDDTTPPPFVYLPRLANLLRLGLVILALALFAISLRLPAVRDAGGWGNGHVDSGRDCLFWGVVYYPSNLLLVLSPLIISVAAIPADTTRLRAVLACVYSASAVCVLLPGCNDYDSSPPKLLQGYWMWAIAHCLAAVASWMPVLRAPAPLTS